MITPPETATFHILKPIPCTFPSFSHHLTYYIFFLLSH